MRKILLLTFLIIFIPFIIINIFVRNDEIILKYSSNMVVRVKSSNEIHNVPFEEYIIGVVAGEMPISFHKEALKAQAVAARSYVMNKMQQNIKKDYDVVDTVINQVYLDSETLKSAWKENYINNINKIKQAVMETSYEYLEYKGKIVDAMFFSTSCGFTENSEEIFSSKVPYLRSVESSWDKISPVFEVTTSLTQTEFCSKLNIKNCKNIRIDILSKTSTGRVKSLKINDNIYNINDLVRTFKLKSTYVEIQVKNDKVFIKTKGYGHGVGMSQYGAQGMALEGYNYEEILSHYYKNVKIKKINA